MLLYWTLCFNFWSHRDSMVVAEVVAEVSKHFTGSKHSFFNGFLHGFTQLPKYVYLKDYLPFWGNHKPLIDFWEGTHEVLKVFHGKLLWFFPVRVFQTVQSHRTVWVGMDLGSSWAQTVDPCKGPVIENLNWAIRSGLEWSRRNKSIICLQFSVTWRYLCCVQATENHVRSPTCPKWTFDHEEHSSILKRRDKHELRLKICSLDMICISMV